MKYAILDENRNFLEFRDFEILPAHKTGRVLPVIETIPPYDNEYQEIVQNIVVNESNVEVTYQVIQKSNVLDIIRQKRNILLTESDWTQFNDSPLSLEKKQEWAGYRQQLRDLPNNWNNQLPISFPIKPI